MNKKWVTFFSQTGSEISLISKKIGRWPDLIVTNREDIVNINEDLKNSCADRLYQIPKWPKNIDYMKMADSMGYSIFNEKWKANILVTLHGYLRILPPPFCDKSRIFNGHPGLITKYPELKGFNPQEKTWNNKEKYEDVGCVIHRVTPELDSGEVVAYADTKNIFESLEQLTCSLHEMSVQLWCNFLNNNS